MHAWPRNQANLHASEQIISAGIFVVASYADALWARQARQARHAIFLTPWGRNIAKSLGGGILRDEPKERLRMRLFLFGVMD